MAIGYLAPNAAPSSTPSGYTQHFIDGLVSSGLFQPTEVEVVPTDPMSPTELEDAVENLFNSPDIEMVVASSAKLAQNELTIRKNLNSTKKFVAVGVSQEGSATLTGTNVWVMLNTNTANGSGSGAAKRLALLKNSFLNLSSVAVIYNNQSPAKQKEFEAIKTNSLGLTIHDCGVAEAGAIQGKLSNSSADALLVLADPLLVQNASTVMQFWPTKPSIGAGKEFTDQGASLSLGPDREMYYEASGTKAAQIARGTPSLQSNLIEYDDTLTFKPDHAVWAEASLVPPVTPTVAAEAALVPPVTATAAARDAAKAFGAQNSGAFGGYNFAFTDSSQS